MNESPIANLRTQTDSEYRESSIAEESKATAVADRAAQNCAVHVSY